MKTRTCAYDRAGIGFSDPARRPSTAANIVDDLHRLLATASVAPPYLLVGQSSGGLDVRLFASTFPSEVAGMVLIDPTHEDQREEYRKLDPQKRTLEEWVKQGNPQREFFRKCADAAAQGLIAGTAIYKECIGDPDPSYSADAYASYLRSTLTPGYWLAQLSENENVFNASSDQVRAARQSLGEIPLVVLTSAPRPRREPETQAENDVRNLVPVKLHEQIAALSSHGVHRAIADSGHDIQADQPKAVVDAILEVLEDAREPKVQAQPVPSP